MPDYPHHLRSFDYRGQHRYFLTFCTFERQSHFAIRRHVEVTLANILRASGVADVAIPAYCFMPDHVHLLVEGVSGQACLKTFVSLAKQLSGFHFKREFGRRLWQRYGYERVLRE